MPQPHVHRALLAASSAVRFSVEVRREKSTTAMSVSVYAMLDIWETPSAINPAAPITTSQGRYLRRGLRVRFRGGRAMSFQPREKVTKPVWRDSRQGAYS